MHLFRRVWYQGSDESITVCALQKARHGPRHYVNVGFNVVTLGDPHPRAEGCHLPVRAEQFIATGPRRAGLTIY